ncbi:MAG: hypothetical protein KatS3mg047_0445 [Bellilinea sp.]|nr:MAG: hypothetical protein KatS3mg047_0445 [Bellilinea sp.]
MKEFIHHLTPSERAEWESLNSPIAIQNFLDSLSYVGEERNRSPLNVLRDRQCHCLDGGLLAALALSRLGFPPLLMDLVPEPGKDDDHVLAVYRINGGYGAIAKSNFVGLRFREPVYRTLRELAMSYFEMFYNINGEKTLRGYTRPINLARFRYLNWAVSEEDVAKVVKHFYSRKSIPLLKEESIALLSPVDRRSYEAGMLGTNFEGLYRPVAEI